MPQRIQLSEGYTINRVINGCWQLSEGHTIKGGLDFQDIMRAFHQLTDQGFTTFDCGDIYTGVEEFLGKFVLELKNGQGISPHDIQIHTKYVPDLDMLSQVNFQYTEKIIDRSLKRLNRDVLDNVVDVLGDGEQVQDRGGEYDPQSGHQAAQRRAVADHRREGLSQPVKVFRPERLAHQDPRADTPSDPWYINVAGRLEYPDGFSSSIHYFTTTEWVRGKTYSEQIGESAPYFTDLLLYMELGEHQRSIDLIPYVQSAPALPGTRDTVTQDVTMTSYVDPRDGRTYYSFDGGKTFEPLTDEEFAARFPTPKVEWWTYDEYKAWLENEKVQLGHDR